MSYKLIIVESPGKVKSLSRFLGTKYKVQASLGHVRDLPKSQLGIDVENNFEPRYIPIRGRSEVISKLKREAENADYVYLATDPDREGEAISWHLANLLELDGKLKCRVTFNEITKNAVLKAVENPREIDMGLVDAQQARRILDRIVGYKISPLLWKKVKKGLSAGRVQSVAVRLISDREDEIENFVPEEYWSISALLNKRDEKKTFLAKFHGNKKRKMPLKDKEAVDRILAEIKDKDYIVDKITKGERKRNPYAPFITSTLQQDASRRLGFTANRTMMVAQQLYEGVEIKGEGTIGLITYMRTDSVRVSNEAIGEARELIGNKFGKAYLPAKARIYKNRSTSQDGHEAIRPSDVSLEPDNIKHSLNADQYKLYKLIWDRFLASQMTSAVYDTLRVDIAVTDYIFRASGSRTKFDGFLRLYDDMKEDKEEGDQEVRDQEKADNIYIPELNEGEILKVKEIKPQQHFTKPPGRYTEATLVKALEEEGIGRPSTYAPIINTIITRDYVAREARCLIPTELGRIITGLMKLHFPNIVDVEFTAFMEEKLDSIEESRKDWVEIIREFYTDFEQSLLEAEKNMERVKVPEEVADVICEKCGKNMVVRSGMYGKFLACPGFPECKNTKPIIEAVGVGCPECKKGKVIIRKTKKGRKYFACDNYPECKFMSWHKPTGESCPKCGSYLIEKYFRSNKQIICSNKDCDFKE